MGINGVYISYMLVEIITIIIFYIYASIYNPLTLEFLGDPKTKEEWDEIYRLLDKVILNK